jgi:hypothetical protein
MSITHTVQPGEQQRLIKLDEETYLSLLGECREAVECIRQGFRFALDWYHYLGRLLVQFNLRGEEIKRLAHDLGRGFSQTTLYRCIKFAGMYPDLEAFKRDHEERSWRGVTHIIVKRPRKDLHACKTSTQASSSWAFPCTITCPHCARSVPLTLEYADRKISVRVNTTATTGSVAR